MNETISLKEKIDDFEMQLSAFSDFCEFVHLKAHDSISCEYQAKLLNSALSVLSYHAKNIKNMSGEIFNDTRMIEFYYSEKCNIKE